MKKQQPPQQNKKIGKDPEQKRLFRLTSFERGARSQGFNVVAGIDEAGRGPLAGPVVAAACIIPDGLYFRNINDSKLLTPEMRETLFSEITSNAQVVFAIGIICQREIERVNIYQATILAMLQAISGLSAIPDYLLVDGLKLPHPKIPCLKIIKGDALSQSIAAASVIAKVTRDRLMVDYGKQWPHYGFENHKGYSTPQHFAAIAEHGPCEIHRFSFEPIRPYLSSFPEYAKNILPEPPKETQLSLF
ncbi:MAG TPA: ribonuclease HII [Parachlamydiaceae bacterium]|nr:ribonuclease HII [Parachlamydiaceae bacterium]